MNKAILSIAVNACVVCLATTTAEANDMAVSPKQITFYEVPLVCPAAPEIGCGSRSKPILLQLEQERTVSEAWLNRPGTIVAIVWKPEATREEQKVTFDS